jgi:outer membrane protein TolC
VTAAQARVRPAGTRADPSLAVGLIQIPVRKPSLTDDDFTMLMVGITQNFPFPGKLALRTRAAALDAFAAGTTLDAARLGVVRTVKDLYYELAYLHEALAIATRTQAVLVDVVRVTEARYSTGTGSQQDVLKARVETARLAETAGMLEEARHAVLAQLNATRDRDSDTPVTAAMIPERVSRAAIAADLASVRFATTTLGARVADSPLPALAVVQDAALRYSPMLREHELRIAAQAARVDLARKDYTPDFDVSVQYSHRVAFPDLLTTQISIPLRLQKAAKQDQAVVEAVAQLSALEAGHRADVNAVRARVATLLSDLERNRTQLALYAKAILPQSRGGVTSALASFQSGRATLLSVLDLQNTVFTYETSYYRSLSDFAKGLAELEQVTGTEVLR